MIGLIAAFAFLMYGMYLSFGLIQSGMTWTGSIFSAVLLLSGAGLLANRRSIVPKDNNPTKK